MPFRDIDEHERWAAPNTHPCAPYSNEYNRQEELRKEEEYAQFDRVLKTPPHSEGDSQAALTPSTFPAISKTPSLKNLFDKTSKAADASWRLWDSSQISRILRRFQDWFFDRTHFYKLRKTKLVFDLAYLLIGLLILELIKSVHALRTILIWYLSAEFMVTILLWLLVAKFAYDLLVNLSYGFRGLPNGPKLITLVLIIGFAIYALSAPQEQPFSVAKIGKAVSGLNLTVGPAINLTGTYQNIATEQRLERERFIHQTEQVIFEETNRMRVQNGIRPLALDERLSDIAREHSGDMAANNYFSHINLRGEDPRDRARRHGYPTTKILGNTIWEGIAENIGKMATGNVVGIGYVESNPKSVGNAQVQSWIQSTGHRENILNSEYDTIGVGVAYAAGDYIATQNFR